MFKLVIGVDPGFPERMADLPENTNFIDILFVSNFPQTPMKLKKKVVCRGPSPFQIRHWSFNTGAVPEACTAHARPRCSRSRLWRFLQSWSLSPAWTGRPGEWCPLQHNTQRIKTQNICRKFTKFWLFRRLLDNGCLWEKKFSQNFLSKPWFSKHS